ncbi:MAG TPA: hypothetical protein VIM61_11935 [Chthoniobacterales bacterium]|jgi:hypothetical protein
MKPLAFGIALLLLLPAAAFADGGAVISQQVVGPYRVTLFGSPSPLRAGPADLSVMLQDAATGEAVLDRKVAIQVQAVTNDAKSEAWVPPCCSMKPTVAAITATHAVAQNKLLYAANVLLPASGPHQISVIIGDGPAAPDATLQATAEIAPPAPPASAYWAYLAAPPIIIAGFALNQRLRRRP